MDVKGDRVGLATWSGKEEEIKAALEPQTVPQPLAVSLARLIQSQSNNRLQSGFRAYTNACNSTMQLTESLYTDTCLRRERCMRTLLL